MEPELQPVEEPSHLISPPLPEPLAPPIAFSPATLAGASSLWRWNDRLALIAGGLTLILLGVISGRVAGPSARAEISSEESIAAFNSFPAQSQQSQSASVPWALGTVSEEEVNPPELVVESAPPHEPPVIAEKPALAPPPSAPILQRAEQPAPQIADQPVNVNTPGEEAAEANSRTPKTPSSAAFSVSFESRVQTIKPPATTQVCGQEKKFKDRQLNTALTWAESVSEANQQAEEENKLVFLIHVSGNFEVPGFT